MKPPETYTPENEQGLEAYQNRLMCVEIHTALNKLYEQQEAGDQSVIPEAKIVQLEDKCLQMETLDGTPVVRAGTKGLSNTNYVEFFVPGLKNKITKERVLHKIQVTSDETSFKLIGDRKEFGYPEDPVALVSEVNSLWGKQDSTKSDKDYLKDVFTTLYKQYSRDMNSARLFLGLAVVATGAFIGNSHIGKTTSWLVRNLTERGSFDEAFAEILSEMGLDKIDIKFSLLDHTISGNDLDHEKGIIGEIFSTFVVQAEQFNTSVDSPVTKNHVEVLTNKIGKYKKLGMGSSQQAQEIDQEIILESIQKDLDKAPIIATDGYIFDATMINDIVRASLGKQKTGDLGTQELIRAVPYMMEVITSSALIGKISEGTLTQLLGFCARDVKLTNLIITSILTGTFVTSIEYYYEQGIKIHSSAAVIEPNSELSIAEKIFSAMKSDNRIVYNEDDMIKGRNLIMALNTFGALKVLNDIEPKPPKLQFFAGYLHSEITGEFLNGEAEVVRQLELYISTVTDNITEIYKNLIQNETDLLTIEEHEFSLFTIMSQMVAVFPPYVFGNKHIISSEIGDRFPISKFEIVTPQLLLIRAIRKKALENNDNEFGKLLRIGIGSMLSRTSSFFKREPTKLIVEHSLFENSVFHEIEGHSGQFDKDHNYYISGIIGSAEVNGRELPIRISRKDSRTVEVIMEAEGVSIQIGLINLENSYKPLNGHIYTFAEPDLYSMDATTESSYAQKVLSTSGTVPEFLKDASYMDDVISL